MPKPMSPPKRRAAPSTSSVLSAEARRIIDGYAAQKQARTVQYQPPKAAVIKPPPRFRGWDRASVSISLYDGHYLDIGRSSTALFDGFARTPDQMVSLIIREVRKQLTAMVGAKKVLKVKP